MIIRNSKFKQIIPDNFTYKGTKYTKAYYKDEILFAHTDDDYAYQYFTIESFEDGNVITLTIGSGVTSAQMTSFSYSVDNGSTWNTTTVDSTTQTINVSLDKGEKVLWKGVGNTTSGAGNTSGSSIFSSTKKHVVYGNIMSLLFGDNFINETSLANKSTRTFGHLFYNNTNIVEAHNLALPATTLQSNCYQIMFEGCTSLTTAPKLPATTLAGYCYQRMFRYTAIVEAPELPATTLNARCYYDMFNYCTSLKTSPDLPNATLAYQCCQQMFYRCTSLTKAPKLPSTTLGTECYRDMFLGCTSLVEAPELPAQTLTAGCYRGMFNSCSSLNYIKCLATDISAADCTTGWVSYVAATGTFIKADTMNDWTIDSVDGIPIGWTLHNYENCTVTLTVNDPSYGRVDGAGTYHTGELVTIKANAIDGYRFVGWYDGSTLVSENEAYTFQIWTDVSYQAVFESGQVDYSTQYFTIEALENNTTVKLFHGAAASALYIYYSTDDGNTWETLHYEDQIGQNQYIYRNAGEKVLIKANASHINSSSTSWMYNWNTFGADKKFKVYGNAMSLLNGDNFLNETSVYFFGALSYLFAGQTNLIDASNLVLPATSLTDYCYRSMFNGCSSLVAAPALPATTLATATECYASMFQGCTSLVSAPALPATTLAEGCYYNMFNSCTSLKTAPILPATTLTGSCYEKMFYGCTSLKTAPALQSTKLSGWCYSNMFKNCTSLTGIISLPATALVQQCYDAMFDQTNISGIKIYAVASSWTLNFGTVLNTTGTYYVKRTAGSIILNACPTGWTISKTL